jgi:hypothetical protein
MITKIAVLIGLSSVLSCGAMFFEGEVRKDQTTSFDPNHDGAYSIQCGQGCAQGYKVCSESMYSNGVSVSPYRCWCQVRGTQCAQTTWGAKP